MSLYQPKIVKEGKMTYSEYETVHWWVRNQLGKPQLCVHCGTTEKRVYNWANISGEYKKDITDWKRLCVSCHAKVDRFKEKCPHGHKLIGDNLVIDSAGARVCRTCRRGYSRRYSQRLKETQSEG